MQVTRIIITIVYLQLLLWLWHIKLQCVCMLPPHTHIHKTYSHTHTHTKGSDFCAAQVTYKLYTEVYFISTFMSTKFVKLSSLWHNGIKFTSFSDFSKTAYKEGVNLTIASLMRTSIGMFIKFFSSKLCYSIRIRLIECNSNYNLNINTIKNKVKEFLLLIC